MSRVILQVPMSKTLKEQASAVSADMGFSSLQETIRVILNKLAKKEITFSIEETEEIINLSPRAKKRYEKAVEDIKKGRNITNTKNLDELFTYLKE